MKASNKKKKKKTAVVSDAVASRVMVGAWWVMYAYSILTQQVAWAKQYQRFITLSKCADRISHSAQPAPFHHKLNSLRCETLWENRGFSWSSLYKKTIRAHFVSVSLLWRCKRCQNTHHDIQLPSWYYRNSKSSEINSIKVSLQLLFPLRPVIKAPQGHSVIQR